MKPVLGLVALKLVALLALVLGSCSWLNKPAPPECQGDPALKPCPCMDPRTPDCPPPPSDAKKPDGGTAR